MLQRLGLVAFVLGFLIATADAQPVSVTAEEQGRIARLDTAAGVVILEDGRMYRVTPGTVLLVDNRAVPFGQLRAGSPVVIRAGEHVALRDGQYVGAVAVPVVAAAGPTLKRTIYGKVGDVDNDGEVEIKTDKGSFEIQLTPDTARYVKKGDSVVIEATFGPPGASLTR